LAEVLTIEELRSRIDVIDEQLVRLLNVRVACAVEVGRLKHEAGLPVYQPQREAQVLGRVRQSATELAGPLTAEAVVRIFERIIDEARRAERHASEQQDMSDSRIGE
jgi:chorismate mutase